MKFSQLFTKTIREIPHDEKSTNAQFLIKAGFIDKLSAGVYTYLPLGLKVLKKIENIIREEMNAIGGQEILMPALHPKENWQKTNRWEAMDDLYKFKDKLNHQYALGATHEEIITPLVKKNVNSYKDLPLYIYQIQDKFRDEFRAKSGILRGREFIMKDLYSFHLNEKDLDYYYEKVIEAYFKIFERLGLRKNTYLTLASGSTFSKYSHEFQTITPAGEDTIYICKKCKLAINKEIKNKFNKCPDCNSFNYIGKKSIEVGNIFKLGDKFSKCFNFKIKDKNGKEKSILACSYGIGLSRLLGTIVEVYHDKNGINWPYSVTPFDIYLINLTDDIKETTKIYKELQKNNITVLWDDREESAGVKFKDADLIGLPLRIIVSEKTLSNKSVEVKKRDKKESDLIKIKYLIKYLNKIKNKVVKINKFC